MMDVTIECDMDDCKYNVDGYCEGELIRVNAVGECEAYEEEGE